MWGVQVQDPEFEARKYLNDKVSDVEEALAGALENMGFAELVNEADGTYQVTNAFHYIEQIILCINIDEDVRDEIPQ